MPPFAQTLLINFGCLIAVMVMIWVVSLVRRDASIIDPFWGTGFVIVAWLSCAWNHATDPRSLLLADLTTVWGLRLSLYLLWRNSNHGEDRRYAAMRTHHGANFAWVSMFTVFLMQAVILWFVAFPLQAALASKESAPLTAFDAVGIAVWSLGFLFESIGDWQMARFQADPDNEGKVMDRGLWRYTRHPNYFGDFCVWWGLYLLAAPAGAAWTIGSPIVMSLLLMKVSGVTLLESTITDRRPDYAAYKARTSSFVPWFPKDNPKR
ncbi:MAG TPA: DUF1295 domain-containing protein [Schlesneria sp.]|jgi:steroid 5-alpha reductase family enzyme